VTAEPLGIPVIIPAWRPDRALVALIQQLTALGFTRLIVINDGSEAEFDPVFSALGNAHVLRHTVNRGKGAALRTGIEYALSAFPGLPGIVTADADGQHLPADIARVARALEQNPGALILGSRAFDGTVPLRSRAGNFISHLLISGLKDTQTGLRGIPAEFAKSLLQLPFDRYEFEFAMLIAARRNSIEIIEQPIATVYEPGNKSSHFRPLRDSLRIAAVVADTPIRAWLWLLLLLPLALEIFGFRATHLASMDTWLPQGSIRFHRYVVSALSASLLFGLFARRSFIPIAIASVIACSIYAVGLVPVAAVLLFVFSSATLGRILFGDDVRGPLALLAGMAVWITAMTLTARLPIHYPAVYLAALLIPFAIRPGLIRLPKFAHTTAIEFPALALVVFLLIAMWLITLAPEISADGLAMHLAIPRDIARHHAFTIDFHHLLWALMPMGADYCYTVVYVLGGEYAARLLNFAMLSGLTLLIFQTTRSYLLTALFLSSPMVYLIAGSMFVENFVAFMALGALAALWQFHESKTTRYLLLTALLLGTAIALKVGVLALALPALALMLTQVRHKRALALAAVVLTLALGSLPYAKAWLLTGNPFFPFQTGPFPGDVKDFRYAQPLSWRAAYDITFHTNQYFEGRAGSFGFQYLLFLPLLAASAFAIRSFRGRTAIILGFITLTVVAAVQLNVRYLYFVTPLLTIGIAASFDWLRTRDYRLFQAATAAAIIVALVNIWFLPTADWYHRDFYTAPLFSDAGRRQYLHSLAPIREVIEWINQNHPDQPVVLTDATDIAGIIPPVHVINWHDRSFLVQVDAARDLEEILHLFRHYGIARMVVNTTTARDSQSPLASLIASCGQPEFSSGAISSLAIRADCETAAIAAKCPAGDPVITGPVLVDEMDPRVRLLGPWAREKKFPKAWASTVSYSNRPDAQACLIFEGTGFDYIYTRAFNRGLARILIDSHEAAIVDLYSPTIVWQAKTVFSGFPRARHQVSIVVLNSHDAKATDSYVDLDAVRVF
jgi:glycosyltransferase involved in cell wall biosynthesis